MSISLNIREWCGIHCGEFGDKDDCNELRAIADRIDREIVRYERLKKETDELKAELDDWKGNAEGFQPDAYMKLPLDADGVPIRIGDVLYLLGSPGSIVVSGYERSTCSDDVYCIGRQDGRKSHFCPKLWTHRQPEPPDSWEKLEEDMMKRSSCNYFGIGSSMESCNDCPHGERRSGTSCFENARRDMLARAKKLAGIENGGAE